MVPWLWSRGRIHDFLYRHKREFCYQQSFSLVNVKLKWVKDRVLDAAIAGERDLKAVCNIVATISSDPRSCVPVYNLSPCRGQLGVPPDLRVSAFVRRYPSIFDEFHVPDNGGTSVPWFRLTPEAQSLHQEESDILHVHRKDLLSRLCKLLMLTKEKILPLQTIEQLKWDMGLPYDYDRSLVPQYPELFSLCRLPDDRIGLQLLVWDTQLAVSELEKNDALRKKEDLGNGCLAFPIRFTRGFGLKRKCMEWLDEWQKLPYTSPYSDASHLDPRTDISEKRIVGVFHELLHLMVKKKTERSNVSNLRKPLALPQKFTKVFERHPGVFYISRKSDRQTVILREAYDRYKLIDKHPLVDIRERYLILMKEGFLGRSRGLYKKITNTELKDDVFGNLSDDGFISEEEPGSTLLPEYESEEQFC